MGTALGGEGHGLRGAAGVLVLMVVAGALWTGAGEQEKKEAERRELPPKKREGSGTGVDHVTLPDSVADLKISVSNETRLITFERTGQTKSQKLPSEVGRVMSVAATWWRGSEVAIAVTSLSKTGTLVCHWITCWMNLDEPPLNWGIQASGVAFETREDYSLESIRCPTGDSLIIVFSRYDRSVPWKDTLNLVTYVNNCPVPGMKGILKTSKVVFGDGQ